MRKLSKIILIFLILLSGSWSAWALAIKSQGKPLVLETDKTPKDFSFLVAGHIYGSHNSSLYPAASLLANIDILNSSGANFMVLLGDIIRQGRQADIEMLQKSLLSKLAFPIFNVPGNHDLADRQLYTQYFGKTLFAFQYSTSLFVFLDSEIDDGAIEGGQLNFLKEQISYCQRAEDIKNIFIFSHRLLWAIGNSSYSDILPFVNDPAAHRRVGSMVAVILPQLRSLIGKNIYFLSGDIGSDRSLSIFYEKEPYANVTYIATGIGDTDRDAFLKVCVDRSGSVTFRPVSLTGQELYPIEYYGLAYWKNYFNKGAYQGQFLQKLSRIMHHKYFLSGMLSGLLICAVFCHRRSCCVKRG